VAGGLDAVDLDAGIVEEGVEQAHGVGAAADAGDQRIRQTAFGLLHLRRVSLPMIDWKSRTIAG
jgi:hypothetical protein